MIARLSTTADKLQALPDQVREAIVADFEQAVAEAVLIDRLLHVAFKMDRLRLPAEGRETPVSPEEYRVAQKMRHNRDRRSGSKPTVLGFEVFVGRFRDV